MNTINYDLVQSEILRIMILSAFCEPIVRFVQDLLNKFNNKFTAERTRILSIFVGVGMAFIFQIDSTYILTGETQSVGIILTGIICSRGANAIHNSVIGIVTLLNSMTNLINARTINKDNDNGNF